MMGRMPDHYRMSHRRARSKDSSIRFRRPMKNRYKHVNKEGPPEFLIVANDEHHFDGQASRPEASLLVREGPPFYHSTHSGGGR